MPFVSKRTHYQEGGLVSWKCSKCEEWKPLEDYHLCAANKTSGRQRRCKSCMRDNNRDYMKKVRGERDTFRTLRVRITTETYTKLAALGYQYGESVTCVLRSIVLNYLDQTEEQPAPGATSNKEVPTGAVSLLEAARRAITEGG